MIEIWPPIPLYIFAPLWNRRENDSYMYIHLLHICAYYKKRSRTIDLKSTEVFIWFIHHIHIYISIFYSFWPHFEIYIQLIWLKYDHLYLCLFMPPYAIVVRTIPICIFKYYTHDHITKTSPQLSIWNELIYLYDLYIIYITILSTPEASSTAARQRRSLLRPRQRW